MERFSGMAKTANVNTSEVSKAFMKDTEPEKFDIEQL